MRSKAFHTAVLVLLINHHVNSLLVQVSLVPKTLRWTSTISSSSPTTKLGVTSDCDPREKQVFPKQPTTNIAAAVTNFNKNKTRKDFKAIEIEEYEGYARCLSPREEKMDVEAEFGKDSSFLKRLWRKLRRQRTNQRPGTLILRSGLSEHNQNSTFTGWLDPHLTPIGIEQCRHAGRLLMTEGLDPDVVYSSRLQRSITSAWTILESLNVPYIPIQKTYRLNNRVYDAIQGLVPTLT